MGSIALDTSFLIAVLMHEPDAPELIERTADASGLLLSSANYMEAGIVWDNRLTAATDPTHLNLLIELFEVDIVPVDLALAEAARAAYRKYGKGNHKAGLNMGDCFAYALAKTLKIPLLYKGGDFDKTDVKRA